MSKIKITSKRVKSQNKKMIVLRNQLLLHHIENIIPHVSALIILAITTKEIQ